ncbi:hypothetical protein Tco_0032562, partial [Tanacetum coccineum]
MASGGSNQDAEYTLSKLLQMGMVAEYESEFVILANRVTSISQSLPKSFYISGLKPALQCALLRSNPTTLGEIFLLARATEARFTDLQIWELLRSNPTTSGEAFRAFITEARFEAIVGKKPNIKEKVYIIPSWPSEEAPHVVKGPLDANKDIGVVEVSSAIDNVFDIGKSNVESMEVRSGFSEFSENKESVEEVVVGGGEACGVGEDELNRVISALKDESGEFDGRLDEINLNLSKEFVDNGGNVIFEGVASVTAWVPDGGRMVLCYVQGSGRRKRKKKVLVAVAEGGRTAEVEDGTAERLGYGIP